MPGGRFSLTNYPKICKGKGKGDLPPRMIDPFLSPSNAWHVMHTKAEAMGITQRVIPFMDWLREATVKPHHGINALTIMYPADTIPDQKQGIWTSLAPTPPSTITKPSVTSPSSLPYVVNTKPTAHTNQEASDSCQEMGGGSPY